MCLYSFSVRFITNPKRDEIYSHLLLAQSCKANIRRKTSNRHIEAAKILFDLISGADRIGLHQFLPCTVQWGQSTL